MGVDQVTDNTIRSCRHWLEWCRQSRQSKLLVLPTPRLPEWITVGLPAKVFICPRIILCYIVSTNCILGRATGRTSLHSQWCHMPCLTLTSHQLTQINVPIHDMISTVVETGSGSYARAGQSLTEAIIISVHNNHIVRVCVPIPSIEALNKVFYSLTRSIIPMLLLTVLCVKGECYLKYGRDNNVYSLHVYN